jgi:hypothetical protein
MGVRRPLQVQAEEIAMSTHVNGVSGAAIKRAIETRDGPLLASFYTDDAVLRVIDQYYPPSKPREITGKIAITRYWSDICGRPMTHKVETSMPKAIGSPSPRPAPIQRAARCFAWP